ncbi:MAG: 4Fe-4S dicluster domain-containing protein [Proteobacteria bacterium]|nr:4Fe-4S dicluster domain-containing protein [Pseudomonadota bacterium]MBU1583316.1 4Fe-4S dicluster domain-containing protein [Pseudomonadota bacterium]MBU2454632.1 4Fe-4S dicluster domain-containing protein [Pseudomonadota bacterium]MBU2629575.1 4Fe-4S dicluster domain-containing protein [Pseudomonadota bacterium]
MDIKKMLFDPDRRDFMKTMAFGSSAVFLFGSLPFLTFSCTSSGTAPGKAAGILVDFNKCTGCRTCEAVCSSFNKPKIINQHSFPGIGNPCDANIKVYTYNPDVDIPSMCALCDDAPCIQSCPVVEDPVTKNRALFRDSYTHAIRNDPDRCLGCGNCKEACENSSAGIIRQNLSTRLPEGICTLCNGDPHCVKHCPYGALKYIKKPMDYPLDRLSPDKVANKIIKDLYGI